MFRLILAVFLLAAPVLAGEKGDFARFERSLNKTPHGYQVVDDPTGAAPTPQVERFEVRAGECGVNGAWSDCRSDRERSELSEFGSRSPDGTEAWYGFSVYIPADWPDIWPTKTVIAQWHQTRSHPVWMLQQRRGALGLDNQSKGRTHEFIELISADELRGRWWRVELHAKWSTGPNGLIRLYIDGVKRVESRGSNMTAEDVYFRYGVYRSFISRHGHPVPTQTAYFANVSKATTREGLR